jgi:hypothetical protein
MPKNLPLFYGSLIVGLAGVWLFAFVLYMATAAPQTPDANIGAGLLGLLSWGLGITSLLGLIASYFTRR